MTGMCFSATASFAAAAVTGAIGVVTLRRAGSAAQRPLAAMPLLFAVQQAAEGGLWLALAQPDAGIWPWLLTQVFLAFALVIWPVYVPAAVLLIEPDPRRRNIMFAQGLLGVATASFFLVQLLTLRNEGYISGHHILYRTDVDAPLTAGLIYLGSTVLAMLASSHRMVVVLGAVIFAGAVTSWLFMEEAFVSVWCFFAAAASVIVLAHVRLQVRRAA